MDSLKRERKNARAVAGVVRVERKKVSTSGEYSLLPPVFVKHNRCSATSSFEWPDQAQERIPLSVAIVCGKPTQAFCIRLAEQSVLLYKYEHIRT
jgi:hypothetical protein